MSDFMDMIVDMLPVNSKIQNRRNPFRTVLDKSVGEYMDNTGDVFDELFLDTASGGWLDAHGRDCGVMRNAGESDDDYRDRIVFEKLEHLTAHNLMEIYGLDLYVFVDDFSAVGNDLTSDNPYLGRKFMSRASPELRGILDRKFILDGEIVWL